MFVCNQALQEELAWARLTGKPRPAGFPPNTSCSRAALALEALAASAAQPVFDVSGPIRQQKQQAKAPNVAKHMAAANAAIAAGKKMHQLTQPEVRSLLHQLHRDNGWLLSQLKDSNAALEQLHDRMEAEQQVGNAALTFACGNSMHCCICDALCCVC